MVPHILTDVEQSSVDISVDAVDKVIENVLKQKDNGVEYWQWFDKDVNAIAGADGAGGIRQIGRMLLANNILKSSCRY